KPAVEFTWLAGEQRVYRRIETERRGVSRHVMDIAVGEHDPAGEPVRGHVGQTLGEVGKEHGAVAVAVARGRCGMDPADIEIGRVLQPLLEILALRFGARISAGNGLALRVINDEADKV